MVPPDADAVADADPVAAPPTWDEAPRSTSRMVAVLDLDTRLPDFPGKRLIADLMIFGRFEPHIRANSEILPQCVYSDVIGGSALTGPGGVSPGYRIETLRVVLGVTFRDDAVLLLDVELGRDADVDDVVALLAGTCWHRFGLELEGIPLLEWVRHRLLGGDHEHAPTRFGRHVHQIVFPSEALARRLGSLDDPSPSLAQLIYRGTRSTAAAPLSMHFPPPLNSAGTTLVAHGRGVAVVAGWAEAVENCLVLVAATLVTALGVVQRTRSDAFVALKLNQDVRLRSPAEERALVERLAVRLLDMQLDLSFGAEAFADSVLIPEMVIEGYHASLRSAVEVASGLEHTSRMLERLRVVIEARRSGLEAAVAARQEQRTKIIAVVGAVGSLIALPPALLLAFFGTNGTDVDPHYSIVDLHRYGWAYLVTWLPFVLLLIYVLCALRAVNRPKASGTVVARFDTLDDHG